MSDPARRLLTLDEAARRARDLGRVPLGFLSYDVDIDEIRLDIASDLPPHELEAVLQKFGMHFRMDDL